MKQGRRGIVHRHGRERGIAALEFAVVLPVLLALLLGIVYYGIILALEQMLTLAAAEGARAALRYPSGAPDGSLAATQELRVTAAANTALATLPAAIQAKLASRDDIASASDCAAPADTVCVSVTLRLPATNILPRVPFVPMPGTLIGSAVAQLAPDI